MFHLAHWYQGIHFPRLCCAFEILLVIIHPPKHWIAKYKPLLWSVDSSMVERFHLKEHICICLTLMSLCQGFPTCLLAPVCGLFFPHMNFSDVEKCACDFWLCLWFLFGCWDPCGAKKTVQSAEILPLIFNLNYSQLKWKPEHTYWWGDCVACVSGLFACLSVDGGATVTLRVYLSTGWEVSERHTPMEGG